MLTLVGEPGTGLADEALIHTHVDQRTFPADALAVENVELGLLERWRDLVLDHFDPGAVTHCIGAVLERLDPPDVQAHRRVELQRLATRGRLRGAEHHADLVPELVDEDCRGARIVQCTSHFPQRLAHQPGLQTDVAVTHLAFEFRARHQRRHRVDDHDVERTRTDQHVGDLKRLFSGVRLADQQRIGVDAQPFGVVRVQRVLGVDERRDTAGSLGIGHRVQRDGGLTGGLRAVDFDDPAPGRPPMPSATSSAMDPVGITEMGWRTSSPRRITEPLP